MDVEEMAIRIYNTLNNSMAGVKHDVRYVEKQLHLYGSQVRNEIIEIVRNMNQPLEVRDAVQSAIRSSNGENHE